MGFHRYISYQDKRRKEIKDSDINGEKIN